MSNRPVPNPGPSQSKKQKLVENGSDEKRNLPSKARLSSAAASKEEDEQDEAVPIRKVKAQNFYLIVCAKKHEAEKFVQIATGHGFVLNKELCKGVPEFESIALSKADHVDIRVVSFNKGSQGPLAMTLYLSEYIRTLSKADFGLVLGVGMVGVCGGRELHSVIVGHTAIDPLSGTVDLKKEGDNKLFEVGTTRSIEGTGSRSIRKPFVRSEDPSRIGRNMNADFSEQPSEQNKPKIKIFSRGTFFSFSAVRNDLDAIIKNCAPLANDPAAIGIDMEAHAFFTTVNYFKLKCLPVVKGVSDVDREDIDERGPPQKATNFEIKRKFANNITAEKSIRGKLRGKAGENAAIVMFDLVMKEATHRGEIKKGH